VTLNGKQHHVGYFASEDDAGAAVSAARVALMPFSEDARRARDGR
jgi:hypothetical protein